MKRIGNFFVAADGIMMTKASQHGDFLVQISRANNNPTDHSAIDYNPTDHSAFDYNPTGHSAIDDNPTDHGAFDCNATDFTSWTTITI